MSHEILQRVRQAGPEHIWIPGRGNLTAAESEAQRFIEEYDERFVLARHNVTGDWVIFVKLARDDLYPVMGLGREIPPLEEIKRRMYQADALRRGDEIRQEINRRNEDIQKAKRAAADAAIGETAEHLEWGYRREGWHPNPRIFVP